MRNTSTAAAMMVPLGDEILYPRSGIQFDDERFSPEERRLEATRQLIWEKLMTRLRAEFPAKGP